MNSSGSLHKSMDLAFKSCSCAIWILHGLNPVIEIAFGIFLKNWVFSKYLVNSNLILRLTLSPVRGNFALGSPLTLMGTVCLNFSEPLSKCSPSGLNELQIHLTNAESERNTSRKAIITYKRPENVFFIHTIILFHAEEIPLTLMGIFFFDSQCLHFCLCCIPLKRLQGSLQGPRLKFLKPPWNTLRWIFSAISHIPMSQPASVYYKAINMKYTLEHSIRATNENSYFVLTDSVYSLFFEKKTNEQLLLSLKILLPKNVVQKMKLTEPKEQNLPPRSVNIWVWKKKTKILWWTASGLMTVRRCWESSMFREGVETPYPFPHILP